LHRLSTAFVLGYHGCDASAAKQFLSGAKFKDSANAYDWLGSGVYFWEANPLRGLDFARELQLRPGGSVKAPAVIGAVIEPGLCLDLLSSTGVAAVEVAHDDFIQVCKEAESEVPTNHKGDDLLLRNLDCAVINHLHKMREVLALPPFDTVRGVFIEGERIYEGAGFFRKTHTQLCVKNHNCIKGIFRVPKEQLQA
jgi:hypothetical protein